MKKMFMAVIALMMTINASAQFYIYFSDGSVAKVDSISMIAPEKPSKPDQSSGIGAFSVSATKRVTFSPGNLQYTQSTNTWSFASAQYEFLGTDNVTGGSVESDPKYGDKKHGTALADKIDLFGWSTSATYFGISSSTDDNDYSGSFVDWGTNQINDYIPNTWRTLTYDEWNYLRNGRPNASSLCGVAQVNDVKGLIFLPDNWICPDGLTFRPEFHSSSGVLYQSYTIEQWSKLEAVGAVFLPYAGNRNGFYVSYVQCSGDFWSASDRTSQHAYSLNFYYGAVGMVAGYDRHFGASVRLVKDLQ